MQETVGSRAKSMHVRKMPQWLKDFKYAVEGVVTWIHQIS